MLGPISLARLFCPELQAVPRGEGLPLSLHNRPTCRRDFLLCDGIGSRLLSYSHGAVY